MTGGRNGRKVVVFAARLSHTLNPNPQALDEQEFDEQEAGPSPPRVFHPEQVF
jgi:hypothetical protein